MPVDTECAQTCTLSKNHRHQKHKNVFIRIDTEHSTPGMEIDIGTDTFPLVGSSKYAITKRHQISGLICEQNLTMMATKMGQMALPIS
ncbi:MAG: hypothetical protein CL920_09035 [Deltaproteobacteria bacterium]|nr:hypothetical protein [Deltaproteobacteria bacterium]